jgi:hypothetical protein
MANTDIFGRTPSTPKIPFTADKATIDWGGPLTSAINVSVSYSQAVQRRRTIGNKDTIIYASQPLGTISIARLLTEDANNLFNQPGWRACDAPATIKLTFRGGCEDNLSTTGKQLTLTCIACLVSQFQISAEAEGLTVIDNVVIEFLQLQAS